MPGRLYVCATPIGNLGDRSERLREVLGSVDVIYAEDTRRTSTLTRALGVETPLRSYFTGNEAGRARELRARLEEGAQVALVSDAGMPGIADPGHSAVAAAIDAGAEITVVPGPSAVTAALAVSGLPTERFVFEGFLPRRGTERERRLADVAAETRTVVLFSATARVGRDLADLSEHVGASRQVVVGREMTKLHEEVWRGTLGEAVQHWVDTEPRGEFTIVVAPAHPHAPDMGDAIDAVAERVAAGESMADAVRNEAGARGIRRRRLYESVLAAGTPRADG
jgi:16S rRNA (cytidine1402-2'-O)-methyltransferase